MCPFCRSQIPWCPFGHLEFHHRETHTMKKYCIAIRIITLLFAAKTPIQKLMTLYTSSVEQEAISAKSTDVYNFISYQIELEIEKELKGE